MPLAEKLYYLQLTIDNLRPISYNTIYYLKVKRKNMKGLIKITLSLVVFVAFLFFAEQAKADVRCESQYGGGQVCVTTGQLQINKKVFDSNSNQFVDNLGLSSRRFASGDEITFSIEVKNTGSATINNVNVADILPSHLQLSSGDLNFNLGNLTGGQSITREIKTKVVDSSDLSANTICEVNTAQVTADNSMSDKDTTQVCLGKAGVLPQAGPENWFIIPFLSLVAIGGGLLIRFNKLHTN